jgi:hypothetical protein
MQKIHQRESSLAPALKHRLKSFSTQVTIACHCLGRI